MNLVVSQMLHLEMPISGQKAHPALVGMPPVDLPSTEITGHPMQGQSSFRALIAAQVGQDLLGVPGVLEPKPRQKLVTEPDEPRPWLP